ILWHGQYQLPRRPMTPSLSFMMIRGWNITPPTIPLMASIILYIFMRSRTSTGKRLSGYIPVILFCTFLIIYLANGITMASADTLLFYLTSALGAVPHTDALEEGLSKPSGHYRSEISVYIAKRSHFSGVLNLTLTEELPLSHCTSYFFLTEVGSYRTLAKA